MSDYAKLTRAELIARLQTLESAASADAMDGVRDAEERLRAILETAVEGIITIDELGIIESMNPAAERIFGYRAKEVAAKNVNVLMPSPYREEHDTYVRNYVQTGKAKIIGIGREVVGQRKDGTTFPMDLAVSEVRLAGRRLFTGFVRDITERKKLEKEVLEISDQERRRLGQDLHDGLCQHLAGTELMSRVLEQKLSRRSKVDAARAGEIAGHVREAISQTRSLARGLSPVTLESEGLASALQELAANAEKVFNLNCQVETAPSFQARALPLTVGTHLYRIAQEAVSNAWKHGKASEIRIRLDSGPEGVALRVIDNGRGLQPSEARGKGMGLRIMQYRASMIAGVLLFEANPGGGTMVTCSVPVSA